MTCLTQKTAVDIAVYVGDQLCRTPLRFTAVPSSEPDTLRLRIKDPEIGMEQGFSLSYRRTTGQFEAVCRSVIAANVQMLRVKSRRARDEQAEAEWVKTITA